jgi:hypothetical protein
VLENEVNEQTQRSQDMYSTSVVCVCRLTADIWRPLEHLVVTVQTALSSVQQVLQNVASCRQRGGQMQLDHQQSTVLVTVERHDQTRAE